VRKIRPEVTRKVVEDVRITDHADLADWGTQAADLLISALAETDFT